MVISEKEISFYMGIKMPRIIHEVGVGNRPYTAEEEATADEEDAAAIEYQEKLFNVTHRNGKWVRRRNVKSK